MMTRLALALSLLLPLPALAQSPPAMSDEARSHWNEGQRLYAADRYDEAIRELEAGRRIDPRPEFLYALGQAERKRGRCDAAITHFRAYLAEARAPSEISAASLQIERCERQLERERQAAPAAAPSRPPPIATEAPPAREGPPWYLDVWGGVLSGAGVAALIASAILYVSAESAIDPASYATLPGYEDALDARDLRATAGAVTFAVGAALLAAGVLRYVLAGGSSDTTERTRAAFALPRLGDL